MTFKQVIIKIFWGNVRQYLAFFLCSTFSIMVFFMNVTLVFNKDIMEGTEGGVNDLMSYLPPITIVGITLFSIFFIVYANNSFVKGRYKELGVYLTLGMDNKEIRKLINVQNLIISGCSVVIGVIFGALLSRIFQMAIIHILNLQKVSFNLDGMAFLVTIVVFVLVFAIVFLQNHMRLRKLDILGLLKEERQMSPIKASRKNNVLGILGVIFMLSSLWMVLFILNHEKYNSNVKIVFLFIGLLFAGMYLTISKGGAMLISYGRTKSACHFSLLSIAETEKKYEGNKRIIFILSILSSITITLVASPFSLLGLSETIAEMNCNNVEYVETETINKLEDSRRDEIINQEPITYKREADFIYLFADKKKGTSIPMVSVETYNQLTGEKVQLQKGQCMNINLNWMPGYAGYDEGSNTTLYGTKGIYEFNIVAASHGPYFVNQSYPSDVMLLINAEDYAQLNHEEGQTNWGIYHMIGYENWKNTKQIVTDLKASFTSSEYVVLSTYDTYVELKQSYSAFLFMTTVLGILFFVSGGTVLYFRQFTELVRTKENFDKLYKVGIIRKEVKSIITKELSVIFFVPLVFGAFGGICINYMLTHMVGGSEVLREFMINNIKVIVAYFIFQGVFYNITKKQYVKACSN